MNIWLTNQKLKRRFGDRVRTQLIDGSIVLTGLLKSYDDMVEAGMLAVAKDKSVHVVNHIKLKGYIEKAPKQPSFTDSALEGERPDVMIIGGGISGCSVARELTKYNLSVLLVEKAPDLALGASGANDGEVHPGVDLGKGSLKQKYVLLGNAMYEDVCRELDVPFERKGQYVGFFGRQLKPIISLYALQRRSIGVKDTKIISKEELLSAEPEMNPDIAFGLYNPSAGTVCPYGLTIAYAENAAENGAKIMLNTFVKKINVTDGKIESVETSRGTVYPSLVVNAAGVWADKIAAMAGDEFFSIHPRKGTNSILDKKAAKIADGIVSFKSLSKNKSHTKGGGVIRTVHGNILVGPDAVEVCDREDTSTNKESVKKTFDKQRTALPGLAERDIITCFSGVRAPTYEEDFIIEPGRKTKNLYHVAGIQSPGLTTAPAVAKDVASAVASMLGKTDPNPSFDPVRHCAVPRLNSLPDEERDRLIKENPDYGVIVCRCEEISRGEIIGALKSPVSVPTLDGVKRRVRPGMGRCQGGFCSPNVVSIIAEFLGVPEEDVRKSSEGSVIVYPGKVRK